ncbi:hypothetical protein, partial [Thiolapillus sp.]|uniref:hypothetical protein n=1 Tax=Thiolapillus sp. TaxID=2017437 RepID=UPI003AF885AE
IYERRCCNMAYSIRTDTFCIQVYHVSQRRRVYSFLCLVIDLFIAHGMWHKAETGEGTNYALHG